MGAGESVANRTNRRISQAGRYAFRYMDITSLLAWRSTSRANCLQVNVELRSSLIVLIARFFPNPLAFLDILTPWGALIVGEAALSHVLHDPSICNNLLEVAVGNVYFEHFLDCLSRLFPVGSNLHCRLDKSSPEGFSYYRHITRVAEFRLLSGLCVLVYESSTPSACDVVAGYWTTALMNFVTEYSLGCAYPRLTLNLRSLDCDIRSSHMGWSDRLFADALNRHGFRSRRYPHGWPMHAWGPLSSSCPIIQGCGRSLFVCPLQGRYFGDSGSLVLFHDGLNADLGELRDLSVAPYGPMVTWRMPSSGLCTGDCVETDSTMPPFTVSILTQFFDTPSYLPPKYRATALTPDSSSVIAATPPSHLVTAGQRSV